LANVRTLEQIYRRSLARAEFTLIMLAIAGALALLLGVIGLYGVLSYAVSRRTREIGIRLALGSPTRNIGALFVGQGLTLTGIGIALGLAGAAALSRVLQALLHGVSPLDPLTFLTAAVLLMAAGLLASYLPTRRATTVDPAIALRSE
jgi:ABC-type antimicrobial peptide transport system permease subunit